MNKLIGRILAVDDNEDNLLIYKYIFEPFENAELVFKEHGQDAIDFLKNESVDIIILDVEMPGLDGYETAKAIQKIPHCEMIPILFITAHFAAETFKEKGFEVGAVDYLVKPLDENQLINRVRLYLELSKSKRKLQENNESLERLVDEKTKNLLVAKEKAEAASRFKSEFFSNMSHELRTPLHAILTLSRRGATKLDKLNQEKLIEYFKNIRESGERMLNLVDNLLDLNKLELHSQVFNFQPYCLGKLTEEVVGEFKDIISSNKIEFDVQVIKENLLIVMDKKQMSTVIRNLINNAIKYNEGNIQISIQMEKKENQVIWRIFDNGVGIPEGEKERIFEPFRQSSITKSKAGGKGIGLSICNEIIKVHDGYIKAEMASGKTCFVFALPIKAGK